MISARSRPELAARSGRHVPRHRSGSRGVSDPLGTKAGWRIDSGVGVAHVPAALPVRVLDGEGRRLSRQGAGNLALGWHRNPTPERPRAPSPSRLNKAHLHSTLAIYSRASAWY